MKRGVTFAAKLLVYLMGIAVVVVCAILLPELAREEAVSNPNAGPAYPFLVAAWVYTLPIFLALYQTLQLINYVDTNQAFSPRSIKALQNIKLCALTFSVLIIVGVLTVIILARSIDFHEDVTPVVSVGAIFLFASSIIATFIAVLQKVLQDAIGIKSENDLII